MNRSRLLNTAPSVHRIAGLTAIAAAVTLLTIASPTESAAAEPAADVQTLSLDEIERRLKAEGLVVEEMEIEGLIVEVDARDADGREVDLKIDRRTGEILARKFD
ncbi:MAG TPA: PepSY domain-containing protein [Steroidobacter sp.]|jgi:hypothetical protein|nr:PepSY domain-containing protein [Steroidobacteraceae bacterium]HLS82786.1 PepSY domain-containing protein [Steroidobacter sp.]